MLSLLILSVIFMRIQTNFVCPPFWKEYKVLNGTQTKCMKPFYELVAWDEAKRRCQQLGTGFDLLEIHSRDENYLLVVTLLESGVNSHLMNDFNEDALNNFKPQVWIGPKRVPFGNIEDFEYTSGCGIKDFSGWHLGEPNDHFDNQDCVYVIVDNMNSIGQWVDYQCQTKMYYMCQFVWDVRPPCNASNYNLFAHNDTTGRQTITKPSNQVIVKPMTNQMNPNKPLVNVWNGKTSKPIDFNGINPFRIMNYLIESIRSRFRIK